MRARYESNNVSRERGIDREGSGPVRKKDIPGYVQGAGLIIENR